jgi:hypothetical protein
MEILIVNFSLNGITEAEYSDLCDALAPAFAAVPGLVTKVWLADSSAGVYGGVYTFDSGNSVDKFTSSDLFGQVGAHPGLTSITVKRFGVLDAPTAVTRGLVGAAS